MITDDQVDEAARGDLVVDESFTLGFECEVISGEGNGEAFIRLNMTEIVREGAGFREFDITHQTIYSIPAKVFPNKEARQEWAGKVMDAFREKLSYTTIAEAGLLLADSSNYFLDLMGYDRTPKKEMVEQHLVATRKRVSGFLGARGQRSPWSKAELELAMRRTLATLKKENPSLRAPTLDQVADVLRVMEDGKYKDKAPVSGEALGALLRRFKIDWQKLKPTLKQD